MAKKYLEIGDHGLNGDFYIDSTDPDGAAFRADNLEIATRIAFNDYLRRFDNIGREMTLKSIKPGSFTMFTREDGEDSSIETHTVEYYGPSNMFEIESVMDNCDDPEFKRMLAAMETALNAGSPSVRASKRTGRVMFSESVRFPRYRTDGEWLSWEHRYLSTDIETARIQMQIAGITY